MRGTGCSGGAFDFFEPLQSLDGYDIIETIARQPWVKHGKVGMMGISYGGISQLFTAQTQPAEPRRDLAALGDRRRCRRRSTRAASSTPASRSTGPRSALHEAQPAGPGRRPAVGLQADPGGRQDLHGEPGPARRGRRPAGEDPRERHLQAEGRRPALAGHVRRQDQGADLHGVPVADEQTGGHCPTLASRFTGTDKKWFTFTNGTHVDSLAPGDLQPLVRLPEALRREAGADAEPGRRSAPRAPVDLRGGDGRRRA